MSNSTRRANRRPPPAKGPARPAPAHTAQARPWLDWAEGWLSPPPRALTMAGWALLPFVPSSA